jgi:hypothetical protein
MPQIGPHINCHGLSSQVGERRPNVRVTAVRSGVLRLLPNRAPEPYDCDTTGAVVTALQETVTSRDWIRR